MDEGNREGRVPDAPRLRRNLIPIRRLSAMMMATGATSLGGLRRVLKAQEGDGPPCPRCYSRRTWVSGESYRCRRCGTRFEPKEAEQPTEPEPTSA